MKRLLVTYIVFLAVLAGCQSTGKEPTDIEVIIKGQGQFPESLAGKWLADRGYWEFVFEPDGKISSAVINMGAVKMVPGKIARFPTRYGGKGIFEPGLWTVWYAPDTRELTVEVVIKHFYQDMGEAAIEGNVTDMLTGPVSEDGKTWQADWFSFGKFVAYIPEPNEFYNVSEPEYKGRLVFEKVEAE